LTTPIAYSTTRIDVTLARYRINKSFATVQFDLAGKGRIVFLPEGAELSIVGYSRLPGCFEVVCKNKRFNMFEADLFGPWSTPIKNSEVKPARAKVMRVCA
jgi:hypothetical protein